jgi:hypothetical protein
MERGQNQLLGEFWGKTALLGKHVDNGKLIDKLIIRIPVAVVRHGHEYVLAFSPCYNVRLLS